MADQSFMPRPIKVFVTPEEAEAALAARFVPDRAEKAKRLWARTQENNRVLGVPSRPEPDWSQWDPTPAQQTLSPALPLDPPPWLLPRMNPAMAWISPTPAEPLPVGQGPTFDMSDQPTSLLADDAPAQPTVFYPNGNTEVLALRPMDVWNGLKLGGKMLWENGRWIVRVGNKVLGPIGAIGSIKDVYDFTQWLDKKIPDGAGRPPRTRYEIATNQILWEQPGGFWTPYPPTDWAA